MTATAERIARIIKDIPTGDKINKDDGVERVLSLVEQDAKGITDAIIQGPRIFLWPKPNAGKDYFQNWNYKPFTFGWAITRDIADRVRITSPNSSVELYAVINDTDNRPAENYPGRCVDPKQQISLLRDSSTEIAHSPIFLSIEGDPSVKVFSESEIPARSKNEAYAQRIGQLLLKKIREVIDNQDINFGIENINFLNIILTPWGFGVQENKILEAFLGLLTQDEIMQKYPKKSRRDMIEKTFRNIWIDENSQVTAYTRPLWQGNKFTNITVAS